MTLNARAWLVFVVLTGVMGVLLFGAAGTMRYWHAWVYIGIYIAVTIPTLRYLVRKDPALLERRMRGGPMFEKERTQRIIMTFTSLGFIALLVVPALDRRFGWSSVPVWTVVLGDVLVAMGYYFILLVYRVDSYTASTIQVVPGQTVTARARLVLGLRCDRRDDAVPALAASRRRTNLHEGFAAIRGVPAEDSSSSCSVGLVGVRP